MRTHSIRLSPSRPVQRLQRALLACGALLATASLARAQCPGWDATFGASPSAGAVTSFHVFDDGSGPALYAGGGFNTIGGVAAASVARWDGTTWSPAGAIPAPNSVSAFAVHDDGGGPALYAGGGENATDGGRVWRWDGTAWSQVGATMFERVYALASFDDGSGARLYAWRWTQIQGPQVTTISELVRFDGASWTPVLSANALVFALTVHDDGAGPALWIGGGFSTITSPGGTIPAQRLVRWDGTTVTPINVPGTGAVRALHVFDDGTGPALYVAGTFPSVAGVPANNVARLHVGTWSALGSGVGTSSEWVGALASLDDGADRALYAAGGFATAGGNPASRIARWDGANWSALGSGIGGNTPLALAAFDDGVDGDDDLYAGGFFTEAGGHPAGKIARWIGCATEAFCSGDGSSAPCPCANTGTSGHGCENSAATGGALLAASGSADADSVVLTSSGELSTALSIFLQGNVDLTSTSGAVVFGDGVRCVGGALKRLYVANAIGGVVSAPNGGDPSIQTRSATLGDPIASGSTRWYQVYYRDSNLAFCPAPSGDGFNVSSGLRIVW